MALYNAYAYVQVKCAVIVQLGHQYTDCTAVQYVCPCGRFNQIWTAVRWRYTRGVTAPVGLGHSKVCENLYAANRQRRR